jgi:hypothetical protein
MEAIKMKQFLFITTIFLSFCLGMYSIIEMVQIKTILKHYPKAKISMAIGIKIDKPKGCNNTFKCRVG